MKDKQLWFDKYIVSRNLEYRTLSLESNFLGYKSLLKKELKDVCTITKWAQATNTATNLIHNV